MPVESAGLLMYRNAEHIEFFLIHPGGPYWKNKNDGAWSIPKGLIEGNESMLDTAKREFTEETGIVPKGPFQSLGSVKTKSGKILYAWSFSGEWDSVNGITSNYIDIEFPPRSKKFISIPEADRADWMTLEKAKVMINTAQIPFLERAEKIIEGLAP